MWKSVLFGALGLAAFETLLTSRQNSRLAGLLKVPGDWARAWLDPSVPLVPNWADYTPNPTKGQLGIPSATTISTTTPPAVTSKQPPTPVITQI